MNHGLLPLVFDEPVAVIGDIHGRADLLAALLEKLGSMTVISVGDVVDRGMQVRECIDLLIARGAIGVKGNHEEWVCEWLFGDGFDRFALHPGMGGAATLQSYGVYDRDQRSINAGSSRVPEEHRRWFLGLHDAIDLTVRGRRYFVCHTAPSRSDIDEDEPEDDFRTMVLTQPQTLRWGSYTMDSVPNCGRPVVAGHMSREEPEANSRVIAIDTGCATVPGGYLTAVILPEKRFISVR